MRNLNKIVSDGFNDCLDNNIVLDVISKLNNNLKSTEVQFLLVSTDGVEMNEIINKEEPKGTTICNDDCTMIWDCFFDGKFLKIDNNIININKAV